MKPGKFIRKFRKNIGLSQPELANKIGFSQKYLSDIELGKVQPSREVLKKLKEVFGIPIDDILYGAEEKQTMRLAKHAIAYGVNVRDKKLHQEVEEILKGGDKDLIRAFETTIKAFLNSTRAVNDRRKYPRSLLKIPIDFQMTNEPEAHSGIIINASQVGVLVQTSHDMPIGKKLNLRVPFGGDTAIGAIKGKGEIIWKGKRHLDNSDEYQYGIKLLEVLDESYKLELLIHGCDEKKSE